MTEPEKGVKRREGGGGGEAEGERRGEREERTERGPFSGVRSALGEATGSDGRC